MKRIMGVDDNMCPDFFHNVGGKEKVIRAVVEEMGGEGI